MQHLLHKTQFDAVLGARHPQVKVVRSEHFYLHCLAATALDAAVFDVSQKARAAAIQSTKDLDKRLEPINLGVHVGVILPKRLAKRAVTRNLMRRQIYARAAEIELIPAAYVIRLGRPFLKQHFKSASSEPLRQAIRQELRTLFLSFAASSPPNGSTQNQ